MTLAANPMTRGRLKTRHIVLLVHLHEQRSVLRAAKAANMTQPEHPNCFPIGGIARRAPLQASRTRHRTHRVREIMIRHARSALAEMDRAQDEIAALRSGLAGQCAIGAVVSAGTHLAPKAIASLKQQHPRIRLRIEIDNSVALVDRLVKGELDVALARVQDSHGADELVFEPLAGETHHVIVRTGHPLVGKRVLELADLVAQPWIRPSPGSLLRDRIDAMFVQRGLGLPRNLAETTSIPVIISLLQETDMVAALQDVTVEPYLKAGFLAALPLTLGMLMEPCGIITRRNHQLSPSAEAMLKSLHEAADAMYPKSSAGVTKRKQRPKANRSGPLASPHESPAS